MGRCQRASSTDITRHDNQKSLSSCTRNEKQILHCLIFVLVFLSVNVTITLKSNTREIQDHVGVFTVYALEEIRDTKEPSDFFLLRKKANTLPIDKKKTETFLLDVQHTRKDVHSI